MPVYTYHCDQCGVTFERNQKFTDAALMWCPECGKKSLRKVYSAVGIVFKGSGFYSTDHRSPSGSGSVSASRSSSAEEKPTEVKPAPSSESSSAPSTKKSDD